MGMTADVDVIGSRTWGQHWLVIMPCGGARTHP